jgi:hypothetical protein
MMGEESGGSSAGERAGVAVTIGCCDNGAVCSTTPRPPSLIPLSVSSTRGLLADAADALSDASNKAAQAAGNK